MDVIFIFYEAGLSSLRLVLSDGFGDVLNGETPDTFEALDGGFHYLAHVAEDISGWVAAQVWDEADNVLVSRGFVRIVPGRSVHIINNPEDIASTAVVREFSAEALAQIAALKAIHISVPCLIGNELSQPLVQGDSYLAIHNRQLPFSRGSDFADIPEGSTVKWLARGTEKDGTPRQFQIAGEIVSHTGTKTVRFQPDSDKTAAMKPGKYEWQIKIFYPDGNSASFLGPGLTMEVLPPVVVTES